MNRDHLTPEQRPTKNGNIVTRWVNNRATKKASDVSSAIPAPGLTSTTADTVYTVEPDDSLLDEYTAEPREKLPSTLKSQNINY